MGVVCQMLTIPYRGGGGVWKGPKKTLRNIKTAPSQGINLRTNEDLVPGVTCRLLRKEPDLPEKEPELPFCTYDSDGKKINQRGGNQ